jgi:hypothetical protein
MIERHRAVIAPVVQSYARKQLRMQSQSVTLCAILCTTVTTGIGSKKLSGYSKNCRLIHVSVLFMLIILKQSSLPSKNTHRATDEKSSYQIGIDTAFQGLAQPLTKKTPSLIV